MLPLSGGDCTKSALDGLIDGHHGLDSPTHPLRKEGADDQVVSQSVENVDSVTDDLVSYPLLNGYIDVKH